MMATRVSSAAATALRQRIVASPRALSTLPTMVASPSSSTSRTVLRPSPALHQSRSYTMMTSTLPNHPATWNAARGMDEDERFCAHLFLGGLLLANAFVISDVVRHPDDGYFCSAMPHDGDDDNDDDSTTQSQTSEEATLLVEPQPTHNNTQSVTELLTFSWTPSQTLHVQWVR